MKSDIKELERKLESGELALKDIPKGGKKKEIIAKKKDTAQEEGEKLTENMGRIPDKHLKPEREIQSKIRKGFMDIRVKGCRVSWVNFVHQQGTAVWQAKARGWIIVTGNMVEPDDLDLLREDNTFKVGDVMAMCIPEETYAQNHANLHEKAAQELAGEHTAELHELRKKSPKSFNILDNSNMSAGAEHIRQTMRQRADNPLSRQAAQQMALDHIGNKMKEGVVPGIPIK